MSNMKEYVILDKSSIKLFPNNTPCDFKYKIPLDYQNISTLGVAIRKISCKIIRSNFTVSAVPSIILTDHHQVSYITYDIIKILYFRLKIFLVIQTPPLTEDF